MEINLKFYQCSFRQFFSLNENNRCTLTFLLLISSTVAVDTDLPVLTKVSKHSSRSLDPLGPRTMQCNFPPILSILLPLMILIEGHHVFARHAAVQVLIDVRNQALEVSGMMGLMEFDPLEPLLNLPVISFS